MSAPDEIKVSEMTAVVTPLVTDYVNVIQGGTSKKESVSQFAITQSQVSGLTTSSSPTFTGLTLTNLNALDGIVYTQAGSLTRIDNVASKILTYNSTAIPVLTTPGNGLSIAINGVLSANINTNNLQFTTGAINTIQDISNSANVLFQTITANSFLGIPISSYSSNTSATPFFSAAQYNLFMCNQDSTNNNWMFLAFNDHNGNICSAIGTQVTNQSDGTCDLHFYTKPSAGAITRQMKIASTGEIIFTTPLAFTSGGFGINSATSGGIPYFSSTSTVASSAIMSANQLIVGGGAGSSPISLATANNSILVTDGSGVPTISSVIPSATQDNITRLGIVSSGIWSATTIAASVGGTGQTSYAIGDILYASASTTLSKLADIATGNALISGGITTAPSWGKIGLTTHVTGVLPYANGGSNASTSWTQGSIFFAGASAFSQDNANFFWDGTNHRLGLGITSPLFQLDIRNTSSTTPNMSIGKWTGAPPTAYGTPYLKIGGSETGASGLYTIGFAYQTVLADKPAIEIGALTVDSTGARGLYDFVIATSSTNSLSSAAIERFRMTNDGFMQLASPSFTANGTQAVVFTSLGPGAIGTLTISKWVTAKDASGNKMYWPVWQ